jgi:hypothetical protein
MKFLSHINHSRIFNAVKALICGFAIQAAQMLNVFAPVQTEFINNVY